VEGKLLQEMAKERLQAVCNEHASVGKDHVPEKLANKVVKKILLLEITKSQNSKRRDASSVVMVDNIKRPKVSLG